MTTVLTETRESIQDHEKNILQLTTNTVPVKSLETKTEVENRREKRASSGYSIYDVFLTFILSTLHFLYLSFISIKTLNSYIYNLYLSNGHNNEDIPQRIQYDKTQLTKIPGHLTINISRELLSSRTLGDWEEAMYNISIATCWAWEFGIKEVSVYDASGVMKSMEVELYKQQSNMVHNWINTTSLTEKNRPAIKFSILSGENGQSHMGHVAQEIALQSNDKSKIDIKLVDKYMHENTISDPDLMIVYDGLPHNYISLDGYPPWFIRLTEIANCSNYHKMTYDLFSKCLYRYSRVEQRLGR